MPRISSLGSPAQVALKKKVLQRGAARAKVGQCIVAEGDSWFDYVVQPDLVDHLIDKHDLPIISVAHHGHILMDMVYGMELDRFSEREPGDKQQLKTTLDKVEKFQPKVFLFSGGGNDIAGPELMGFLLPAEEKGPKINWPRLQETIDGTYAQAFRRLHAKVNEKRPGIHFVTHGYANPFPDGRSVYLIRGLFEVAGPWLKGPFEAMGYSKEIDNFPDMVRMMGMLNDMLKRLSQQLKNFHYVDLRNAIPTTADNFEDWWDNELHPTQEGFKAGAAELAKTIKPLLSQAQG